jgi:hypothetical protein
MIRRGNGCRDSTFGHPFIAIDYATYLSPKFAIIVTQWTARFIAGDITLIKGVQARVDEVHGTKSLITHTMVDKTESDEKLSGAHEQAAAYQAQVTKLQSKLQHARQQEAVTIEEIKTANNKQLNLLKSQRSADVKEFEMERQSKDDQISDLAQKLQALGVSEDTDASYLNVQQQRKRRRHEHERQQLRAMNKSGGLLQELLLQRAPESQKEKGEDNEAGEQPGVSSMPARFLALTKVRESTNGKNHKIAHALIKATLACMGENLMKYVRAQGPGRSKLLGAVAAILNEVARDNPNNRLCSNVFITNFICGNIKRILLLKHATYMTLGQLYGYVQRFNAWFLQEKMSSEFQLVQQHDLERVLGYEKQGIPKFPVYSPCDIRQFFDRRKMM